MKMTIIIEVNIVTILIMERMAISKVTVTTIMKITTTIMFWNLLESESNPSVSKAQ